MKCVSKTISQDFGQNIWNSFTLKIGIRKENNIPISCNVCYHCDSISLCGKKRSSACFSLVVFPFGNWKKELFNSVDLTNLVTLIRQTTIFDSINRFSGIQWRQSLSFHSFYFNQFHPIFFSFDWIYQQNGNAFCRNKRHHHVIIACRTLIYFFFLYSYKQTNTHDSSIFAGRSNAIKMQYNTRYNVCA